MPFCTGYIFFKAIYEVDKDAMLEVIEQVNSI
jgi:hypothetical protein